MQKTFKDITGKKFGRWTILGFSSFNAAGGTCMWECECACGAKRLVSGTNLKQGRTQSCGCLQKERVSFHRKTHGKSNHPLYQKWHRMLSRCGNPKHRDYFWYGARGIKVCERWHDFSLFLSDMEDGWKPTLSLDRIDNNRGYEPLNCRWATAMEQVCNTRRNIIIDTPWGRMAACHAADKIGVNRKAFLDRIRKGYPDDKLFVNKRQPHLVQAS